MLRDDEVLKYIKTKIKRLDPDAALLLFILFKKNVGGSKYNEQDIIEALDVIGEKIGTISNLAKYLFEHHEFAEYRESMANRSKWAS